MATQSSILAWRVPWTREPGGLLSMGSHRVGHDWRDLACMHALEKEIATHSSIFAWRIPGTGELGGLSSMGLYSVGHDWYDLAAAAWIFRGAWLVGYGCHRVYWAQAGDLEPRLWSGGAGLLFSCHRGWVYSVWFGGGAWSNPVGTACGRYFEEPDCRGLESVPFFASWVNLGKFLNSFYLKLSPIKWRWQSCFFFFMELWGLYELLGTKHLEPFWTIVGPELVLALIINWYLIAHVGLLVLPLIDCITLT